MNLVERIATVLLLGLLILALVNHEKRIQKFEKVVPAITFVMNERFK